MDLPQIKKPSLGMLDGLKSKLGFSDPEEDYDDERFDDEDEFGEGYEEFEEYGPDYRDDDIDDRPSRGSYSSSRSSSRRAGSTGSSPKLVSIDDVRARTQIPDSLNRDPLPPRRVSSASRASSYAGERTLVDPAGTAHAGTPNARAAAAAAAGQERSESLNSLFSSTAETPASAADRGASGAFDPYDAYAGAGAGRHTPGRSLTVIKPASYGEVERVAKALKAGDVVVLALRNTPDNLAKRILDFSFGVSSALDASVECVADKVFVISRGAQLSAAEQATLRSQGVL